MKKAQIGIEVLIGLGALFVFAIMISAYISSPQIDLLSKKESFFSLQEVCEKLATSINTAAYFGNGYSSKVEMPQYIQYAAYNATVYSSVVQVSQKEDIKNCQIRAKNITYKGSYPPFTVKDGTFTVKNKDGVVYIE
jgi:GH15 family glucan-1,4-alpha-glucosidase